MNEIEYDEKNKTLTLNYKLFELPTAQHKAGLAGLLVLIKSLELRKLAPLPLATVSSSFAQISFTQESMQLVMDDLFDAQWVEAKVKQKWKGAEPKRIEETEVESNGKKKREKCFIYDVVQPKGMFLQTFFSDGDGLWMKLWRNMVWEILRGVPTTRNVFEERAGGKVSSECTKKWADLLKACEDLKKGKYKLGDISSSLFLGAEASNAEKVPYQGKIEENFLLPFWHIVSLIFVPRELEIKRMENRLSISQNKELGYVLAIPEPNNLEEFIEEIIDVLRGLPSEKFGFRPKAALIDLMHEGGLEFLYHFANQKTVNSGDFSLSLHSIELYHLEKKGNRIRQLAYDRILPQTSLIQDYQVIREGLENPYYKTIVLKNLLRRESWYVGAEAVFRKEPVPFFVFTSKTPSEISFFGNDVKRKFGQIEETLKLKKGANCMTEKDFEDQLALRIYRLVQNYLRRKTEEKSGHKYEEFKNDKENNKIKFPPKYREEMERISSDAFLAMRGRRDHDFLEYFTGTLCSIPQFMAEEDFLAISKALITDWQKVKTLAMLAVSATSYIS